MRQAVFFALLILRAVPMGAQDVWRDEATVGSERELYLRVLNLAAGRPSPAWEIRPTASGALAVDVPWHPWRADSPGDRHYIRAIRPVAAVIGNSAFPWRPVEAIGWQGKGVNAAAFAGVAGTFRWISARFAPVVAYSSNAAFTLEGSSGFRDAMRPNSIDQPQRFGDQRLQTITPGESFLRAEFRGLTAGLSNERIFWGSGVRHSLMFSAQAPGFPHIFAGTAVPFRTPLGSFHGQILYARLEESDWAPNAPTPRRFGGGVTAAWSPPVLPLTLGTARFYHRAWPRSFQPEDVLAPFGPAFDDPEVAGLGGADNQIASLFFSLRAARARLEMFGEFGRNDRNVDARDLALEPEHASAWLLGFMKVFRVDTVSRSFWSVRYEAANGRISAIQEIPRFQSTFFEHTRLTQGHTHRGMLLGTPLVDRAQGSELALDRWSARGREGITILQRQMPGEQETWMSRDSARTQWDVSVGGLFFIRGSELTYRLGRVWDLNRFAGVDLANLYVSVGWRQSIGNLPLSWGVSSMQ